MIAAAFAFLAALARIDGAVEAAIAKGELPGAVVVVVYRDQVVYRQAHGKRAIKPVEEAMTIDSVFDLASLTKPLATAISTHLLIEAGKLQLSDPVEKHWPEFAANGKADITVEQLLLHTSGLIADNPLADYAGGKAAAMKAIAELKPEAKPSTRFKYSDVGYLALGELVERISGMTVDRFAAKHVYEPLKMADTGFVPKADMFPRIAPTGLRNKEIIRGSVHDPRAFALGGVGGHAGLFGTANDLARFARMLLNGGTLDGVTILKPETVKRFTEPHDVPGGKRTLGWDCDTAFSSPRGAKFTSGEGFGHTGFTGTSLWIEPKHQMAIIILSNRVHPADKGNATELRKRVGTLVAEALGK